ncbi:hypothetical protein ACFV2S_06000 [Streptomyces sp. NPDC059695]|uniref:hypothetical protein n=1 Tax=Streptomyces sp. NPDC059695 TaxID=3346910 RepID=UPI0036C83A46
MNTQQDSGRTDRRERKDRRREMDARHGPDEPEEADKPLPRNPQNQQAAQGEDPLAIPVPHWPDAAAPETDVAGTGRRGDADRARLEESDVDEPVD